MCQKQEISIILNTAVNPSRMRSEKRSIYTDNDTELGGSCDNCINSVVGTEKK